MSDKINSIVEAVKGLSVLELVELVGQLKTALGVSDAALAGPAVAAAAPAAAAAAAEEAPTSFRVILVDGSANKMGAIKAVREITGLGLGESKALVEGAPKPVKEGVDKAAADELVKKLTEAGCKTKVEGM
jgi:large subunit ribosomal protein L7/L12